MADETSPAYVMGGFQGMMAATPASCQRPSRPSAPGTGSVGTSMTRIRFQGTERFFRPGYAANLVQSWIPALDGADAKLRAGGKVADVGCGYGASTIIMAAAYPNSQFWVLTTTSDPNRLRGEGAAAAGVSDRVHFEVGSAKEYPGTDFDLVCHFDCLHDMGDPVGVARHTRQSLKADGHLAVS